MLRGRLLGVAQFAQRRARQAAQLAGHVRLIKKTIFSRHVGVGAGGAQRRQQGGLHALGGLVLLGRQAQQGLAAPLQLAQAEPQRRWRRRQ